MSCALHLWLGSETSEEVVELALREVNELCGVLGPQVVVSREVEGFESPLFLSYFPHGLEYVIGDSISSASFFHVRVADCLRIKALPYSTSYLTPYDVFVLKDDLVEEILIYADADADASDFEAAVVFAGNLNRYFHNSQFKILLVDSVSDKIPRTLSIGPNQTISLNYESALPRDSSIVMTHRLFRLDELSLETDRAEFTECSAEHTMDSGNAYVLVGGLSADFRTRELFVWLGADVSASLREARLRIGHIFITKFNMPFAATLLQCVNQSFESTAFIRCLQRLTGLKMVSDLNSTATASTTPSDKMLKAEDLSRAIIPKGGKLKMWHANHLDNRPCEMKEYGHFYGNSCHVLVFDYPLSLATRGFVVFCWLGSIAEALDKENALASALNLHDNFGESSFMVTKLLLCSLILNVQFRLPLMKERSRLSFVGSLETKWSFIYRSHCNCNPRLSFQ